MTQKFAFLLSFASLLAMASCREDGHTVIYNYPMHLNFKATFDGTQLEKQKDYTIGDYHVKFNTFTLYVTGISLMRGTVETPLSEAEFLNFFPQTASGNKAQEYSFTYKETPEGNYTGLKIGFGVRPDLNAKTPVDFATGTPLSLQSEYWSGWKSYIFSKIEAEAEIDHSAPKDFETALSYHCGASPTFDVFHSFTLAMPLAFGSTDNERTVELDLKKLFVDASGNVLDLSKQDNQVTGLTSGDLKLADLFMSNWEHAATIK